MGGTRRGEAGPGCGRGTAGGADITSAGQASAPRTGPKMLAGGRQNLARGAKGDSAAISSGTGRSLTAMITTGGPMNLIVRSLLAWPASVARHLGWLAPLFARITVGWVFLWSGWGKLNNLPQVTENFIGWGIPFPHVLTPFVSGVEFFGGLFLLLGLLTRISAGALGIVMIVAIRS